MTYTRGVRTVHFTLSGAGEVSNLTFVAALPNSIERPTTARSHVGIILVGALIVAFGLLIVVVVVELRRRSETGRCLSWSRWEVAPVQVFATSHPDHTSTF